jgi:hypothetical protein
MLLIAEIWLTVAAWKKGWRGWALLPIALAIMAGLIAGGTTGEFHLEFILFDVAAVAALGVMVARSPKRSTGKDRRTQLGRATELPKEHVGV